MRKNRGLFWGVILFVAAMLTACGSVPEPTKEDVLKALEKEGYITEESIDNEEVLVQMNEVKINDDKDGASVECVVTSEADVVRVNTEYKIRFEIEDDKESWKVKKASIRNRTYELINPIPEDDLSYLLRGKSFSTDKGYIYYDDSSTSYMVVNHEIQSAAMLDIVYVQVSGKCGLYNVYATVKYTLSYNATGKNWSIKTTGVRDVAKSFVDGYKVTLSGERVVEDLLNRNSYVHVANAYYYLNDSNTIISDVEVGEPVYHEYNMRVPASMTVSTENVSFRVYYELGYYFDTYDYQWDISYANVKKVEDFNNEITGVWSGRVNDDQVVITINNYTHYDKEAYLDVIVEITLSTGESYRYSAYVYEYDKDWGFLWIYKYGAIEDMPENAYITSFDGRVADGVLTPRTSGDFYLEKVQ